MIDMRYPCADSASPHTVWYWISTDWAHSIDVPVPYAVSYDSQEDAIEATEYLLRKPADSLRWIRIFRTDNENYQCWSWTNMRTDPYEIVMETVPQLAVITHKRRWWQIWEGHR